MRSILLTATAAVLLAAGSALAQDWDTDRDAFVDEDEFRQGAADMDVFAIYDLNEDGVVTEDEYYAATFAQYDRDDDQRWKSEEVDEFMSSIRGADGISQ